ncbi:3-hydroxyacyl-CoA dehydrogenase NAD-binding domain-containing protein [Aeromicrobium sp. 9AM]|uniref:3-hydroxyacyl-CoA dehydrogenase NAD-binding domain-containing protein n=1 Tax=Aeromicrobium sp. 9AM TaxID=2653126 RepID=UPI0012EFE4B7|nr:3-hydroxyacyl-CoA dehydrogenase NAD-binding domain-containing protein [Aeromicrobium sp. 9AM]VXB14567.1 L-carnitine dehydrogenase [Aeromicrobium sp. 9AM]
MSRIAVIGTGVIGRSWAALFLAHGHDVVATDPHPEAEGATRDAVDAAWPALERLGLHETADRGRLVFVPTVAEAVAEATFVQENGPEDPDLKRALLATIDRESPQQAIIASSSSGITPSLLQAMCEHHPERVVVGHPFNPAHLIPLVEVVGNDRTAPWVIEQALDFYRSVGKKPIHVRRELPGHIANRLQAALWQEAYSLVASGAATVADIDTAIAHGPGLRWAVLGPLANQHLSGGDGGLRHVLNHLGPAAETWMDDLGDVRLTPPLIDALVDGVDEELAGRDLGHLIQERDDLLLALLAHKSSATVLP